MKKNNQDEVRRLRDEASAKLSAGRKKDAVALYEQLALLEPSVGDWSRRAAECFAELGRPKDQRKHLLLALRAYAGGGQPLKAIAMGKLAHRIFPNDAEVTRALEMVEEPHKALGTWAPGLSLNPDRTTTTSLAPHGAPPAFQPPPLGAPPVFKSPSPAAPAAGPPPPPQRAAAPQAGSPPADPRPPAPPPPPRRRASVRPEPMLLESIRPDSEPPPRSVLPDAASLGKIAIVVAGAPSDPPGVVSLDGDDILIDDVDLAPSVRSQDRAFGALGGTQLFSDLEVDQRRRLVRSVEVRTLEAGEVLFKQGDPADAMYVVAEGEVIARVTTVAPGGTLDLAVLGAGDFFGEIGLLGDQPRQATIVAKTETTLLAFGREEMTRLVDSDERFRFAILRFLRERMVETLMLTSPIFQPFGSEDRASLKRLFRFVEVAPGTALLQEGKKADGMYVLVAGEAAVRHQGYGEDILLGMLAPGDVFGEMSLLNNSLAVASVVARTRCYALRLPDRYFMEVLMLHPLLLEHVGTLGAVRAEQNATLIGPPSSADAHVTLF